MMGTSVRPPKRWGLVAAPCIVGCKSTSLDETIHLRTAHPVPGARRRVSRLTNRVNSVVDRSIFVGIGLDADPCHRQPLVGFCVLVAAPRGFLAANSF